MIPSSSLAAALLAACAASFAAGVDPALPRYEPRAFAVPAEPVPVVGYNDMREMLEALAARFAVAHPGMRFAFDLRGTRFAPEALAAGKSAFAPMGAEFTPPQLEAYRARVGGEPVALRVAHASLDPRALSGPLAIFVHRDNPLASISLEEAARVFRGEAATWGELGLAGEWARRSIQTYGVERGTALALEFQAMTMGGEPYGDRMRGFPQSTDVVKRISEDAAGIGYAAAMRETPSVRALAVAARAGTPPVALTRESIEAGRYPLDRYLLIYVRPPVTPLVREFLRLALSREGQEAIAAAPQAYIPLSAAEAQAQRSRLDRY